MKGAKFKGARMLMGINYIECYKIILHVLNDYDNFCMFLILVEYWKHIFRVMVTFLYNVKYQFKLDFRCYSYQRKCWKIVNQKDLPLTALTIFVLLFP